MKFLLVSFALTLSALCADKTGAYPKFDSTNRNQVPVLLHDNGDGTYSLSTTASASTGLTDTQLRATPVAVSAASLPLPAGSATEATGAAILAKLPTLGTSRTPTCTAAVASSSSSAGVKAVTFLASSDFAGTLLGQAFAAGASLTFTAPVGDTLGAMAFTRSAGTLFIYQTP